MKQGKAELIKQQFEELHKKFQGLKLCEDSPDQWVIRGILSFSATYNEVTMEDEYSVLISFPENYPDMPPNVQETGGRISSDFHQYDDRTLCLGAPVEVERRFKANPNLLSFVKTLVVEYLYGYSHLEKYGELPFGELSHGGPGIQEYYQDLFNTDDVKVILKLLKIMADGSYRGHQPCPCESGKILRKCHGPILLGLIKNQKTDRFLIDSMDVMESIFSKDRNAINLDYFPKWLKKLNKLKNVNRAK